MHLKTRIVVDFDFDCGNLKMYPAFISLAWNICHKLLWD